MDRTELEAMEVLNDLDVPCGPILDMKELLAEARSAGAV